MSAIRRGRRRRRLRRPVHAPPPARARLLGARVRGRQRRRRHLVLEPLSGRALRRREPRVLVPVLRRAPAGVGVDRALRDAARDPALHRTRRRPLRPAPRHPVRHARAARDTSTRRRAAGRSTHATRGDDVAGAVPASWRPAASSAANIPDFPGLDSFAGDDVPHRPLAARRRRLHRQARRRDRHRLVGDPVDPADRRAGGAAVRVPAHAELLDPGAQRAARSARTQARDQGRLRRASASATADAGAFGSRLPARTSALALEVDARGARARSTRQRWQHGGLAFLGAFGDLLFDREANETAAEFVRAKIREIVRDPEVAEQLSPTTGASAASACASTPATSRRSTGRTSRSSTSARTPIEAITPRGLRTGGARVRARLHRVRDRLRRDDRRAAARSTSAARGGRTLRDKWADGPAHLPRPRHGRVSRTSSSITGPGSPSVLSNMVAVDRAARGLDRRLHRLPARARASRASRRRVEAEDAWVAHVNEVADLHALPDVQLVVPRRERPGQAARVHAAARLPARTSRSATRSRRRATRASRLPRVILKVGFERGEVMARFDPIATPAASGAEHLEPAFAHVEQVAAANQKLADYVKRRGRLPNFLVFLMDDVGWGDFGCYGGGAAVGAPTPAFDRVAAQGLRLTSCYSEPTCSPSRATLLTGRLPRRHGLHRPPMYGEPGGLQGGDHDRATALGLRVRDAGSRQVACRRERSVAAAERRLRRFLRLSLGFGHVHRVARPAFLP